MTKERRRQLERRIIERRQSKRHEPEIMFATEAELLEAAEPRDDETPAPKPKRTEQDEAEDS
jgi:hypothetical protein